MRLLNTWDYTFKSVRSETARYCILSHRWGPEGSEVTYQEMHSGKIPTSKNASWKKINGACELARKRGFEYIWIDTCCIDQSSSAELTEAINSMFLWYSDAEVCFAYLVDVLPSKRAASSSREVARRDEPSSQMTAFRRSDWFNRGWTLQELIAPEFVDFYDRDYNFLGPKDILAEEISRITGIQTPYLDGRLPFWNASIARRISWASRRVTTRPEDTAYCLLGLLQVNMPLLYGEGEAAFFRLQIQVLATTDDESIFAWLPENCQDDDQPYGMLAQSPRDFYYSGNMQRYSILPLGRPPHLMTARGLQFSSWFKEDLTKGIWDADISLACELPPIQTRSNFEERAIRITLRRMGTSWFRVNCRTFMFCERLTGRPSPQWKMQTFFIPQPNLPTNSQLLGVSIPTNYDDVNRMLGWDEMEGKEFEREKRRERRKEGAKMFAMGTAAVVGAGVLGKMYLDERYLRAPSTRDGRRSRSAG